MAIKPIFLAVAATLSTVVWAQTTVDMAEQAMKKLAEAEQYETQVFDDLRAQLPAQQQNDLDKSETEWRGYRDAAVDLMIEQFDGGSGAGLFATNLKTTLTEQRAAVLEAYFMEGYRPRAGTAAGAPSPGEVRDFDGIAFCWIPAGSFPMGCPAFGEPNHDPDRIHDEIFHTVTFAKGFWMSQYEVTQGQWTAVMGSNPSEFKGDDNMPVENVSWNDADAFVDALNGKAGAGVYALPTEAQWEYACRAGTVTPFNTGDWITGEQAAVYSIADGRGPEKPSPVGTFPPNAWNLYDMHGNVEEWCQDWYGPYPETAVTDPRGPATGEHRIQRGGAWYASEIHARSAKRNGNAPAAKTFGSGLRLVRPAE